MRLLVVIVLAAPLLAAVPASPGSAAAHAHPALLQLAVDNPNNPVNVIVQKSVNNNSVEALVKRLGGTITQDLHIINAFSAKIEAKAVPELARAAGVRWVSVDSPVEKSSTPSVFTTWATQQAATNSSSITTSFNSTPIAANRYIWFNTVLRVSGLGATATTMSFDNANLAVSIYGQLYNVSVPSAVVTYDPAATNATTSYDEVNGRWVTRVPANLGSADIFLTGMGTKITSSLPGTSTNVTFSGRFTSDTPGVTVSAWQWSAAVYSNFALDYNALGVKPCDSASASQYQNGDNAGTPENFKIFVTGGALGGGGTNYTGNYTNAATAIPARTFTSVGNMIDTAQGPNGTFASGSNVTQDFAGFVGEKTPDQRISKVEVVLKAYAPVRLPTTSDPRFTLYVGSQSASSLTLQSTTFDPYTSASNAGTIYANITGSRTWQWSDFDNNLRLTIDQGSFDSRYAIYYDAIGLRVTTATGIDNTGGLAASNDPNAFIDPNKLGNAFNKAVRATDVWSGLATGQALQGQGIKVAVVDSGVIRTEDLGSRLIGSVNFNDDRHDSVDGNGHGTFVAGIVAGDGKMSDGEYMGIAPRASILSARVSDDDGVSTEADVVAALQYIYNNRSTQNIKVVNISLNSTAMQSYHTSPLCAAVEVLWFSGIVVVVSAGNNGTANLYPPANDPFVITVGATDDKGTATLSDDIIPSFSAYGTDGNGGPKPDLVAPGTNVIAFLPDNSGLKIGEDHPDHRVNANYFRMSGTSMAAPMVTGAVALMLQDEPGLNPDQVKYRLKSTAAKGDKWPGYNPARAGAGYLDVYSAVRSTATQAANTGTRASQLLWTGSEQVNWGSVNWNSVNWGSVNWGSVNWGSVNWNSVNWGSTYWGQ
jgi:serine protease AprX